MLFQSPIYQQNKGEGVRFYSTISTYIYLYYLYLLRALVFICMYLLINTQVIIDTRISTQIINRVNKKRTHVLCLLFNNIADYLLLFANTGILKICETSIASHWKKSISGKMKSFETLRGKICIRLRLACSLFIFSKTVITFYFFSGSFCDG